MIFNVVRTGAAIGASSNSLNLRREELWQLSHSKPLPKIDFLEVLKNSQNPVRDQVVGHLGRPCGRAGFQQNLVGERGLEDTSPRSAAQLAV